MKIYIFGNQDTSFDNLPFKLIDKIKAEFKNIDIFEVKPNEDLPFVGEKNVVIMDTVLGIDQVEEITEEYFDKITLPPRSSVHDFDLAFQLKYLKKLGKLGKFTIIGLPMTGEINYLRIHSILRKLVAQDIQGS